MNLATYALWYRILRIQSGQHLLSFLGHSVHIPTAHTLKYRVGPKELCFRDVLHLSRIFCCSSISALFLFVCLSL